MIYDDKYFEQIENGRLISRELLTIVNNRGIINPIKVIKSKSFNIKDNCSTKDIFELVEILRKNTNILLTIFNPQEKQCSLLFVSNKDDSLLEYHIKNFLELEEM